MSDQKPSEYRDKPASSGSRSKSSLAELIAKTPGAQTREQLLERIKSREQKRSKKPLKPALAEKQLTEREPLPIPDEPAQIYEDPDKFAKEYWKRLKAKEREKRKPPKRSKPRLIHDNDKPEQPDKK